MVVLFWRNYGIFTKCKERQSAVLCQTTTSVNIYFFHLQGIRIYHQTQGQMVFHQNVLELLESNPRNVGNPHITRLLSCCFLHEQVEANTFLRNLLLHVFQTISATLALSCPNALRRQIVIHLDRDDAPFLQPFWRPVLTELHRPKNWRELPSTFSLSEDWFFA